MALIKYLGGAVLEDIPELLQCEAFPREEFESATACDDGTFKLLEWCSGDCSSDGAKVTICCKHSG